MLTIIGSVFGFNEKYTFQKFNFQPVRYDCFNILDHEIFITEQKSNRKNSL